MNTMAIFIPVYIIMMGSMFWFMQKNKKEMQQKQERLNAALKPGSRFRTVNGMIGTVVEIGTDTVKLDFSPDGFGSVIEVSKKALIEVADGGEQR